MIDIALFDSHNLALQGLNALLTTNPDFRVVFICRERQALLDKVKLFKVSILIFCMHDSSIRNINLITQIKLNFPNIRILVISEIDGGDFVIKVIKAGAKGFLGKESTSRELAEAVYSIRNGYDYFNKTLSQIVLNNLINDLNNNTLPVNSGINKLSSREIEVLKLMGDSLSNQEIANLLFISVRTVETHKNHIMQKLNLRTSVDMIRFAIKNNIIEI